MNDRQHLAETRSLTIAVSDKVFAGLVERGRKAGYTPAMYAKLLFEAGYAARVGKGSDDPILAECVEKRFTGPAASVPAPKAVPAVAPAAAPEPVVQVVAQPVLIPVVVPVPVPIAFGAQADERPQLSGWTASQLTFARLVCREEAVSVAEAKAALAPSYQSTDSLQVLVGTVRKRLRAEDVEIETVPGWGWRVVTHCRAAADMLLGRVA